MICGERSKMVNLLARKYQESLAGRGVASGGVIELFTSAAGTWTVLITRPGAPTCVLGSGDGWEEYRRDQSLESTPS